MYTENQRTNTNEIWRRFLQKIYNKNSSYVLGMIYIEDLAEKDEKGKKETTLTLLETDSDTIVFAYSNNHHTQLAVYFFFLHMYSRPMWMT